MSDHPFYAVADPDGDAKAVALVLHGGRERSTSVVRGRQLAVLRMAPFTAALRRAGSGRGLAVAHLRYLVRGWNGAARAPVADVRWVLDRLAERYPGVPVALVGHSMGGRAAIHAADHPSVAALVALAPWIERGDPYRTVTGRDVLVAHGTDDRITSAKASAAWTRQAATVAESAAHVSITGDGHAMLRRAGLWHALASRYVLATTLGVDLADQRAGPAGTVVGKVLAGEPSIVV
jgi:alpha-beta hydrolase superfamily lysophospholipase